MTEFRYSTFPVLPETRRERIAVRLLAAMYHAEIGPHNKLTFGVNYAAAEAVQAADALIRELDKEQP